MTDTIESPAHSLPFSLQEPAASSPLWIEFSGFPQWVNEKAGKNGWLVMKKVIEIDCARNARPATIEIAPTEIAERCGIDAPAAMRCLEALRKKKCLILFLPDHPEELALIEVRTPLRTPLSLADIRKRFPFSSLGADVRFRYASREAPGESPREYVAPANTKNLQRVIDLYFNSVGFKINSLILDQLRLICHRFDHGAVEKTFERARKNDIRSLGWIVRELYQAAATHERTEK